MKKYCSKEGGGVCLCHKSPCIGENKEYNKAIKDVEEMFGEYNHRHFVVGMIVFTLVIISVIISLII
jgi:hypothetical protein